MITYRIIKVCKIWPPADIPNQKTTESMTAMIHATLPRRKYINGKPSPSFRRRNSSGEIKGHHCRCNESIILGQKISCQFSHQIAITGCKIPSKIYPKTIAKTSGINAILISGISRRQVNVEETETLSCFSLNCLEKQCKKMAKIKGRSRGE